jgi:hypothetical protein
VAYLASSLSQRRAAAVAAVFTLVLASFLLSFLAQFWDPAKRLETLSVLHYYQPAMIVRDGTLPVGHVLGLTVFGVLTWALGGEILARRSLCTV